MFSGLKAGDFHCWRATFRPDTKNVPSRVHVAIVRRSTTGALPVPYSETCDTFRAADCTAVRTGSGSVSFVGFNIPSPMPSGFIGELVAEHRPASVEHGLCHPRLSQLLRVHIADDDQFVLPGDPRGLLVKVMAPSVGDLGVDCSDAALVSGPLRNGKLSLISAIVLERRDAGAIGADGKRLEPEINPDLARSGRQVVDNLALIADVPAASRVFDERSGLDYTADLAGLPEAEIALEVSNAIALDLDGARDKRHPTERPFRAAAGTPAQMPTVGVALGRILPADRLDGIGVEPEISGAAGAQLDQIEGARPLCDAPGLPASFGLALDLVAVVPHLIARPSVAPEMALRRGVFDAVFERQHRHGLFPPVQRGCKALDALGFEYLSAGAPLKPMHSRMWVGANRRFKLWVISKADAKIGALTDVEHFPGFGKEKVDRSHGRKHVTARQRQRREQEWLYAFWRHATQAGFKRSDVRAQNFALALPVLLRVRRQKLGFRFRDANSDGAFVCHPLYVLRIAVHCKWTPSYFAASCGGAPITIVKRYVEQQRQTSR